ncbi:right-handed parallel beta-helix repeat-containing protein [uncultured Victivallis sp.]|uniref:right-handed parallel beta-helix repeat-containing protein n=1 Tax=uncultured Victivallis sp. TaxID=354118 RepID=UPI0025E59BD1|nr:right-handed parallel beta-helix repeat-containing protein [uncultured Victivallis sp.]
MKIHVLLLLPLLFLVLPGTATDLFPWKTANQLAPYRVWGKVAVVPESERSRRGDVEILDGGFTRNLGWNRDETGWVEVSARFRNVPENGTPGLQITLNDRNGFAGQVYGTLSETGTDRKCTALFPVAPDLTQISIWCYGAKGSAVGVDNYTIRLRPIPEIADAPKKPQISGIDVDSTPFLAQLRFGNYLNNSRGAAVERAEGDGEFRPLGEAQPGFHTFTDAAVEPGKTYRYRVKNRSHGAESEWSEPFTVRIPMWRRSPGKTVYFVDSEKGNDANPGTAPDKAWKSLDKVSSTIFAPGDQIRLQRGSVWHVPLELRGSGSADAPIRLDARGEGKLPLIAVKDVLYAVRLKNQSHWEIGELELVNTQTIPENVTEITLPGREIKLTRDDPFFAPYARKRRQTGLTLELENYGIAKNIRIHNLNIHDVEGPQNAKESGGILVKIDGSRKPSRFHNLVIEENTIRHTGRSGIVFQVWPHALRTHWFPSTGVRISRNRLSDIGGDGIVPWACDGVRVTGNVVYRAAATAREANVAIWPWSCDNAVISGNIAAFTAKHQGNGDGQGFDVDTNNFNTLMENNLSFHNCGGFILICGEADTLNRKATVRNNLSISDGMSVFTLWNNLDDIDIHNNTVISPDNSKAVFLIANWGKGDADPIQMKKVNFHDNLIVAETPLTLRSRQKSWMLSDNLFWGAYAEAIAKTGRGSRIVDPNFRGKLNPNDDIPSQLEKLVPGGKTGGAGADIPQLIKTLKESGAL